MLRIRAACRPRSNVRSLALALSSTLHRLTPVAAAFRVAGTCARVRLAPLAAAFVNKTARGVIDQDTPLVSAAQPRRTRRKHFTKFTTQHLQLPAISPLKIFLVTLDVY